MKTSLKTQLALSVSALMLATSFNTASFAQENAVDDEVITTGTRRKARSAADTPAPVDVISGEEFTNQATSDITDLIRTVVPSYNVNTQPISDAATIIRPANLRGLSPDNTLVLLNGKRRHRGSVISFLGGGISDGAQGADIGVFPAIGLKQIEVLRDGASSQYGSDAIAGVINFKLKDASEGGMVEVKYGSTYEGDGTNYRISGNVGLPLGPDGFINISAEYGEADGTSRSVDRADVLALIAAGNTAVQDISVNTYTTDNVQYWGQPEVDGDAKIFINAGVELSENMEVYAFGNYAERTVTGGFFYRNPTNRGGVYNGPLLNNVPGSNLETLSAVTILDADGDRISSLGGLDDAANATVVAQQLAAQGLVRANIVDSLLVGDLAGAGVSGCPVGIPLTGTNGLIPDAGVLATVTADTNCFSFAELAPGGFVPRFGGDNRDIAFVGGIRGELAYGNGLGYDLSASYGSNKTEFFINNTINASLGPNTPRNFKPGAYEQKETAVNLDLTYDFPVEGWASDLTLASGVEWRQEQFDITAGDAASTALGPLASQGFSSSSNGFGGFTASTSDKQSSIGFYGEVGADITDAFTLEAAVRFEDFEKFGNTTNFKVGALYKLTDSMRLRGTYSTGFHAPTGGQANVQNVTTAFSGAVLVDQGTLPFDSAPGQLALDFVESTFGTRPTLDPETANNLSLGVAFETGPMSWTVDYFNIKVKDRIAIVDQIEFLDILDFIAARDGVAGYDNTTILTGLDTLGAAGSLTRADFNGFEDLTSFAFFSNNFDTKTTGFDIVGRMPFDIGMGSSAFTVAANHTSTSVENAGKVSPLSATRLRQLEENLPKWKGNMTLTHQQGMWRGLVRANYHSSYYEAHLDSGDLPLTPGAEITFDAEIGAQVMDNVEIIVGAANLFDNQPDLNPFGNVAGSKFPATAPFGYNGGQYYVKGRMTF